MQIRLFSDPETLAASAAETICELALERITQGRTFNIVLSGGSSPAHTYRQLVYSSHRHGIDWSKVNIFWGDERCVPPDHEQSNYRMAQEALFNHIAIPSENIHRMVCEGDPTNGAEAYEELLHEKYPGEAWPQFDLVLLGLGDDGHTASLFPGSEILEERERWVASVYVSRLNSWRISLTLPAINAAKNIAFLVTGAAKAAIIKQILQPHDQVSGEDQGIPAMSINPQGDLSWFIDQAAGSLLGSL